MMQAEDIAKMVLENSPQVVEWVLMALGALVVAGYAYIKATPTQDDDHWLQALEDSKVVGFVLKVFVAFSPVRRKEHLEKFDDNEAKAKLEIDQKND